MNKLYFVVTVCLCSFQLALGQTCPFLTTSTLGTFPNTYYPANQSTVSTGATTISLGAVPAGYGTSQINPGDVLLLIQMQGVQFRSVNNGAYGANGGAGDGYLNNANLTVGNMEYVVANNTVTLAGGILVLKTGTVHTYTNSAYATDGQYSYQIIRVPLYYDLQLTATLTAPSWNGSIGGVMMLYVIDKLDFNGQTITASGAGFRGGGGRKLSGASGLSSGDYMTTAGVNANGAKGEGIAGTPMYVVSGTTLINTGVEGYPGGSNAKGGPGNAGGGGTDGNPSSNDQNSGGGGGGNGGTGGIGGNTWSSNLATGGKPGVNFAQVTASRLVMGGGGGAGTSNDGTGTPNNGLASSGASGGGIVMIIVPNGTIVGTGTVSADGSAANSTVQNDGAGGGGAGGSIMIYANGGGQGGITASAVGGAGGTNQSGGGPNHGPGGGGGGGVIYSNKTFSATAVTGGAAGFTGGGSSNYGAAAGSAGAVTTNMTAAAFIKPNLSCAVLATSYVNLSASLNAGIVNLTWEATSESTTEKYIIERSTDGSDFSPIGITAPQVPASAVDTYQYVDNISTINAATVYYRIAEVQTTGNTTYSRIVPIQTSSTQQQAFTAFPNPTMGAVTVRFYSAAPKTVNLQLFNLQGAILWQQEYSANEGLNAVSVGKFGSLPEGLYILSWKDGQTGGQVKIMVRR
jgi:hypothetical protein